MLYLHMLALLLFGHALADYPLQGDFLANAKRGNIKDFPWWVAMSAHCFIHAGMVLVITGALDFAFGEFVLHFVIDRAKCRGRINLVTDQALHVACKVLWVAIWAVSP